MSHPAPLEPVIKPICHGMWSVTPYAKCDIRCHYCCTSAQGESRPSREPLERIVAQILQLPEADTVIFGAFSDAYPNAETEHRITRNLLSRLAHSQRSIVIVTKGVTIARDVDILQSFGPRVLVQISISTMDDAQSRRIEPGAAPTSARLQTLHALYASGVRVEVNALPWIPGLSDLQRLLAAIPADVRVNVSPLAATAPDGQQRLLFRKFARDGIVREYLRERARIGPHPQLSWVRPAEIGHHNPLNRFRDPLVASDQRATTG